jgi:F-box and WD-40 domain protein 1/11
MQERTNNMFSDRATSSQFMSMDPNSLDRSPQKYAGQVYSSLSRPRQFVETDLPRLYQLFFHALNGRDEVDCSPYQRRKEIRALFYKIATIELGLDFYRSATFIPVSNGSVRVLVDWHYIYLNRALLEKNWRSGCYEHKLVDGAPDVDNTRHREGIYCIVFDHNTLAAGARDNLIRLWDMESLNYKGSLSSHDGSVLCLQLDSERQLLISGSSDATIKVWDLNTRTIIQTMCGHVESVLGLHLDGGYLASCSKDGTARIWRWSDGTDLLTTGDDGATSDDDVPYPKFVSVRVLNGHRAAVNSVHFLDDVVATASGDRHVRLWNLHTGAVIRTISSHSRGIACVQLVGDYIITGSSDQVVKIMDRATGSEVRSLSGHTGLVRTIHSDHSKLVTGSYDQTIKVWDLKSGEMLHQLARVHDAKYPAILKSPIMFTEYFVFIAISGELYPAVEGRK